MDDKLIKLLEVLEVLCSIKEKTELNNNIEETHYGNNEEEYEKLILQYKIKKYSRYLWIFFL